MTARRRKSWGRLAAAAFVAALLGGAGAARAASCTFSSVTGVSFGSYDVFSATPADGAGNIAYECTGGATVTISLSRGNAPSFLPRLMLKPGGASLSYNLYLDGGFSTVWGDGTGASAVYGPVSPPDNSIIMVPIFGRLPAGQDAQVGVYDDTITATINF
jgi:spore coat protein U-like protein